MHELSLCRGIADIVERARDGRRVTVVDVEVGHLRQVVPQTLKYCWGLVCQGTPLEGARLRIDHIPVRLLCRDCGAHTDVAQALVLVCEGCGGARCDVVRGEEFMVTSMDVEGEGSHG